MMQNDHTEPLTPRQLEILKLVAEGNANKTIAYILGISPFTIRRHIYLLVKRLEAKDRAHAVAIAMREGIIV